jgi:hypothetical protein
MVEPPTRFPVRSPADELPLQHGIRRIKQSAEALALKREKEREKLRVYLELEGRVLDLVSPSVSLFTSPPGWVGWAEKLTERE